MMLQRARCWHYGDDDMERWFVNGIGYIDYAMSHHDVTTET